MPGKAALEAAMAAMVAALALGRHDRKGGDTRITPSPRTNR